MALEDRWSEVLQTLRSQGRYRSFALPQGIDFTSNDYLGYGGGRLHAPAGHGSDLPRTGMSSRLLRGHHPVWDEVESSLAEWHGAPAVLMMTSGYTANEGLITALIEPGDWVASDELNHACIVDGLRLARCRRFSFRHNDLNHLEAGLRAEEEKAVDGRERFIITESLFSMEGDQAPLREIADLAQRYGARLIVDEAHSTGCFNRQGSGSVDAAGIRESVLATVHTGGKALGVPGAYIAGSRMLREYLINRCRHLIFTTAIPAICGQWWLEMLPRVRNDQNGRSLLQENAALFRSELTRHGISALGDAYVVPIILGEDDRAVAIAKVLQQNGFDVRAIRPPSVPPGTARLRVSIHANHTAEQLIQLAAIVGREIG